MPISGWDIYGGGVAISAVFANAMFGAMCGSSTASAAAMSSIIVPEMKQLGYRNTMTGGVIAVGGTLAMLIPPSVPMIIYGTATEMSVGKLLMAGLVPGIVTALMLAFTTWLWARLDPTVAPRIDKFPFKERVESLRNIWPIMILMLLVIGAIYTGIATPTESAALGAMGALIISIVLRRMTAERFLQACKDTIKSTVMIFMIIIGATVFSYYLTMSQLPQKLVAMTYGLDVNRWVIMCIIIVIYLILGMFMDQIAIILLATPIVFPVILGLGFDPIWFGVITIVLAEIGLMTPPVGLNVFIVSSVGKIPLAQVFKGGGVYLIAAFASLILFMVFPEIVMFVPNNM